MEFVTRKILLGLLAGVSLALTIAGDHGLWQLHRIRNREAGIRAEIAQLREQNRKIAFHIQRLKDSDYLEKVIRDDLGYVHPGEVVYYFKSVK